MAVTAGPKPVSADTKRRYLIQRVGTCSSPRPRAGGGGAHPLCDRHGGGAGDRGDQLAIHRRDAEQRHEIGRHLAGHRGHDHPETLTTAVISIPLGVGGAIYLSEYARDTKLTRSIRLALVNLAGIPSVVYGLFGLGMFVIFLGFGTSILAGVLTLAIMTLPVMIAAAEEALRAVPMEFRTVSASLGGTCWQGVSRIVLPQALPGIITGVILGLLRATGETAPILFTVAAFYLPQLPKSVFDQTMALPYHLYVISTQVPGMPPKMQYGTALVLLVFVLSLNILATLIRSYFRRRRQW